MSEAIEPFSKVVALKVASAILAIVASAISFLGLQEVSFFGFPDGHITDYERAAKPVLLAHYYLLAGLGLFFSISTVVNLQKKFVGVFMIASVLTLFVILVAKFGVPLYFGSLDNGVGG